MLIVKNPFTFRLLTGPAIVTVRKKMIDVFEQGKDGYGSYRVPVLLRLHRGVLLAFCEARQILSDHAQNKIVLKRSPDDGETWGKMKTVADAGSDALNNPLVVQDVVTGDVILMYQEYPMTSPDEVEVEEQWISHVSQNFPANVHEGAVVEGYTGKICRTFIQRSSDEGVSWSDPEEITTQVKRPRKVTSYAGGPGIGIQLKIGQYEKRIVMPFSQGPWGAMKVYAVLSDDGGKSWRYGNTAPCNAGEQANEVQVAELKGGSLLLNARSFKGKKRRKTAVSRDGGTSWSPLKDAEDLVEPECQGSTISFYRRKEFDGLLYCGPSDSALRRNGVLKKSADEGLSWQGIRTVYEGFFGYSSICQSNDIEIGVLFERDQYEKISFRRLKINP